MRMDRGEYRSFFVALVNGPDFRQLTPEARLCLFVLKLSLRHYGIGVLDAAAHVLAIRTGLTADACEAALAELVQAGWMEREGDVLWLVRGLECEPQFVARNPKHRKSTQDYVKTLPTMPIVARFVARYADFFGASAPADTVSDTLSDTVSPTQADAAPMGMAEGSESNSSNSNSTNTNTRNRTTGGPQALGVQLTVAANRAITTRHGAQPLPIVATHPHTLQLVADLEAHAVPSAFALDVVREIASTCTEPIRTMKYFRQAILDRWKATTPSSETGRVDNVVPFPGFKPLPEAVA
jgi:hypothetical protein